MRAVSLNISLLLLLALSLLSCDKTPRGVLSVNDMAELIVDLQLADAYIENNSAEFETDSSKLIIKQSVFKKHGITAQEYDSSLVWYAHNMEDYIKAQDKAVGILKQRYDKLDKDRRDNEPSLAGLDERQDGNTRRVAMPEGARGASRPGKLKKLPRARAAASSPSTCHLMPTSVRATVTSWGINSSVAQTSSRCA